MIALDIELVSTIDLLWNRNRTLVKKVLKPVENDQRIWCIAGKSHLWRTKNGGNLPGVNESIYYLERKLKGKKYVILAPTKSQTLLSKIKSAISPYMSEWHLNLTNQEKQVLGVAAMAALSSHAFGYVNPLITTAAFAATSVYTFLRYKRIKEVEKLDEIQSTRKLALSKLNKPFDEIANPAEFWQKFASVRAQIC